MKRNRWGIAAAAVGIHICIGSVYAWSVLVKPIMMTMGLSLQDVQWTFSLAIFFLGLSAAFFGRFVEVQGPRKSGLLSTVCFVLGLLGTALAVSTGHLWLLYLSYGLVGGIGLGIGYITPVSTLIKWFPRNRGFATGLAIMGFGFAALMAGPAYQFLFDQVGLSTALVIMALIYAGLMTASSLYLKAPESGDQAVLAAVHEEAGNKGQDVSKQQNDSKKSASSLKGDSLSANADSNQKNTAITIRNYSAKEALSTWKFYGLWWMLFINITCGIGLLSVASPMAQEVVGLTADRAAALVGIVGIANGLGRLAWASVSDFIGRPITYILFFVIGIFAFTSLAHTGTELAFECLLLLIVSCYGGGFSVMPAYLSDLFGTKALSNIHGKVLTAWAMAGIAGPVLISVLRQEIAGFASTLYVFAGLLVSALVVSLVLAFKGKDKA